MIKRTYTYRPKGLFGTVAVLFGVITGFIAVAAIFVIQLAIAVGIPVLIGLALWKFIFGTLPF